MKYFIFDSGSSLHTPSYCNAIISSFEKNSNEFIVQTQEINKHFLYYHLIWSLWKYKPDVFFIVTGDKFAKWFFVLWLPLILFKKIPCIAFYFSYHNLYHYSAKSFALHVLLFTGLIDRLIVSDPLLDSSHRFPLFLKSKISFAPDYWEPCDSINEKYDQVESRKIVQLPDSAFVVTLVGAVTEKKNSLLLMNICESYPAMIKQHNIHFVLAGSFSNGTKSFLLNTFGSAESLPDYITVRDEFIPNNLLPHYLNSSSLIWCIQNDFLNSSGIFTRACANGTPSIVNPNSTLSSLSSGLDIAIIPPDLSPGSVLNTIIDFANSGEYAQMSLNCIKYASSTSLMRFSTKLNQITSELV